MKKNCTLLILAVLCVACSNSDGDGATTTGTTSDTTGATTGSAATTGATTGGTTGATASTDTVKYATIQGAFDKNCIGCHGENGKGGLDLRSYDSAMKGGEDGPVIKAGDPENSLLIHALRGSHGAKQMPMKATPLPEETIAAVEAWIKSGAKNE
jgi:mono/diheme cytochrome c family protein